VSRPTWAAGSFFVSLWCVGAGLPEPGPGRAWAAESVEIRLESGHTAAGEVDAKTNNDALWLRTTEPSMAMSRPIPWSTVLGARHQGKDYSAAEFQPLAEKLKSSLPKDFFSRDLPPGDAARAAGTNQRASSRSGSRPAQKVASLRIEARTANWDDDVEVDGLEVRVLALAHDGSVVAVEGTLDVRLIGRRIAGEPTRDLFPELGHWGEPVRAADVGTWGAVYRLPFRTAHPEFDRHLSRDGLVHARLGVPGQGAFETSVPVRFRACRPLRDELEHREQRRFLAEERTAWR